MFAGAGGYVFLRAPALSFPASARQSREVPTHPESRERATSLATQVVANTAMDQVDAVKTYLADFDTLFNELDRVITAVLS
jgi:hypothetical protein